MAVFVDIEKKAGDFHLISRFEAGNETLAILGGSGCGKSMTLKCIAGLETPDAGRIVLDGKVLFDSKKRINVRPQLRGTGYLFQNHMLFPNMTVEQNLLCAIPKRRKNKKALIAEKLSAFYLSGLEKQYPSQLSGGQQQRVALARILASEPRLLMLDEPFSAIDSFLKWQLEQEILKVQESFDGTVLFVSHSRDEVYRLCDRIVVMDHGVTQAAARKVDLFADPQTLPAAKITGCKNISDAVKTGEHSLFATDWGVTLRSSRPVPDALRYVGLRAHYFALVKEVGGANTVECEVTRILEDVFSMIVTMRITSGGNHTDSKAVLRYELDKEDWNSLPDKSKLYLKMPDDKLILMT